VHEQAGLRSEAEHQAAVLATRVAQLEAALQRASAATTDAQATHTAAAQADAAREAAAAAAALAVAREAEQASRRAEQASRSELNALREEFRQRSDLLRELQERLELATALGTQSAAAEAATRDHAERLGETVATLEQQCAKLDAGHRALVQRAAVCAMLEQQAARIRQGRHSREAIIDLEKHAHVYKAVVALGGWLDAVANGGLQPTREETAVQRRDCGLDPHRPLTLQPATLDKTRVQRTLHVKTILAFDGLQAQGSTLWPQLLGEHRRELQAQRRFKRCS
jgi:hypothetical protein